MTAKQEKAEYKKFRKHVESMALYLRRQLFMGEYTMDIVHMEEDCDRDGDENQVRAEVLVDPVYLNFDIRVYPCEFRRWLDGKLWHIGQTILHELCHVLTTPMKLIMLEDAAPSQVRYFRDIDERQTQRIAGIINSLLPTEWYLPAKLAKLWPEGEYAV